MNSEREHSTRRNNPTPPLRAFTLIELLVVIAVLTLLMALFFPALQGAKKRSQAVVCQSRLRQLGLIFSLYINENNSRAPFAGADIWRLVLRTKDAEYPRLALCPSATRPLPRPATMWGDTFHAWSGLMGRRDLRGSYGYNGWVAERFVEVEGKMVEGTASGKPIFWSRCDVKQADNIPLFFDCIGSGAIPHLWESPPEYEAAEQTYACPQMRCVCINRHHGGTNMVSMNASVRKVGLKEHWTFNWNRQSSTAGAWTKAGGALPTDWPQWMRRFRDY
jgi:prepilin-type N-terminal cleavage/methylation domain-containing protein